jgi:hypothetical protein
MGFEFGSKHASTAASWNGSWYPSWSGRHQERPRRDRPEAGRRQGHTSKSASSDVQTQVDVLNAAHRGCFRCSRKQRVKDLRTRTVRTVCGTVEVSCRRYFRCKCRGGKKAAIWPLHRHQLWGTSPKLQYLYATWGSKAPYRRAAAVLGELLPICDRGVSHATLRRHTLAIGNRLDQRVTEPDEN